MFSLKKMGVAALVVATIAGSIAVSTSAADARPGRGGGGAHFSGGHHGGGGHFRGGGHYRGGGFHGGRGVGIGLGIASGLALGAYGTGYGYGYGYPAYGAYGYDDGYYGGECVLQRRVRHTPYGPVVRRVRVCY